MKYLKILTLILTLASCSYPSTITASPKTIIARVTYYWPGDSGQVGRQTSTGNRAKCGVTAAVDPKIIPYGSSIVIPKMGKTVVAHDTGSWVVSRKASKKLGKNNIVIDIFCSSKKVAKQYIKKYPMFMKIRVVSKK